MSATLHQTVLRLVTGGMHSRADIVAWTRMPDRTIGQVLRALKDTGSVHRIRVGLRENGWFAADVADEVRRAMEANIAARRRAEWARENERRKRVRRLEAMFRAARRVPASVWQVGCRSAPCDPSALCIFQKIRRPSPHPRRPHEHRD